MAIHLKLVMHIADQQSNSKIPCTKSIAEQAYGEYEDIGCHMIKDLNNEDLILKTLVNVDLWSLLVWVHSLFQISSAGHVSILKSKYIVLAN